MHRTSGFHGCPEHPLRQPARTRLRQPWRRPVPLAVPRQCHRIREVPHGCGNHLQAVRLPQATASGSGSNARNFGAATEPGARSTAAGTTSSNSRRAPTAARRAPLRRGGFDTQTDAEAELRQARELLAIAAPGDTETAIRIADAITKSVRDTRQLPDPAGSARRSAAATTPPSARPRSANGWRNGWPPRRTCAPGTVRSYASHIRLYYQPHIGHISIDRLRVTDVASVFEAVEELNEAITEARASGDPARRAGVKGRRLVGPATQQRIRATLRSAISTYMKQHQGMLLANVASLLELPRGDRPRPLVWTDERVRAWQNDFEARLAGRAGTRERRARQPARHLGLHPPAVPGHGVDPGPDPGLPRPSRPPPAVRHVAADRLARAAPRRGLRAAPHRHRPGRAVTSIRWQITQLGWETAQGAPKSDAGERQVALDADTVADIRAHRQRQQKEKAEAGEDWTDSGFEFTNPDGTPLHPAAVTDAFEHARLPRRAAPHPAA